MKYGFQNNRIAWLFAIAGSAALLAWLQAKGDLRKICDLARPAMEIEAFKFPAIKTERDIAKAELAMREMVLEQTPQGALFRWQLGDGGDLKQRCGTR